MGKCCLVVVELEEHNNAQKDEENEDDEKIRSRIFKLSVNLRTRRKRDRIMEIKSLIMIIANQTRKMSM